LGSGTLIGVPKNPVQRSPSVPADPTGSGNTGNRDPKGDAGPPTLVPVPDIGSALGMNVTRVHQLLRERQLVATRVDGVLRIPAEFVQSGAVVKGLTATITLLTDAGFTDPEIIDWLFASDDSLPGRPITALRENRGREVHRRAQVSGF